MEEPQAPPSPQLRTTALILYGLLALAPANGITGIVAAAIAYAKIGDARGGPFEGHLRNVIVTFWALVVAFVLFAGAMMQAFIGLVLFLFGAFSHELLEKSAWSLMLLPIAYYGGMAFLVWFYYRVIRGAIRAAEARPYSGALPRAPA